MMFNLDRLPLILIVILLSGLSGFGQHKIAEYVNPKFGFRIEYPADLLELNDLLLDPDGAGFESKDGKFRMHISARYAKPRETLRKLYDERKKSQALEPLLAELGTDSFKIWSNKHHPTGFFHKTIHRELAGKGVFYTVLFRFPPKDKQVYEGVIQRIVDSLKFGPGANG